MTEIVHADSVEVLPAGREWSTAAAIVETVTRLEAHVELIDTPRGGEDALAMADALTAAAKRKQIHELGARLSVLRRRIERRLGQLLPKRSAGRPTQDDTKESTAQAVHFPQQRESEFRQVADVPEEVFEAAAAESIATGTPLTRKQLVTAEQKAHRSERAARPPEPTPDLPTGRYQILYADPPWRYDFAASSTREIENQYPTLDVAEICALPVADMAAEDAVLFLWATNPKLLEALQVVTAWGFAYRTNMVWVKHAIGMGYYARQRHELLLIATRGTPGTPAAADRPDSVIEAPRGRHSAKPGEARQAIEAMYPDWSRVELFAREEHSGWDGWGNEHV